ncbi:MAG: hypothetical protein H7068_06835 [Pedobacter sp.]|nr:hypothetical protein [Chitinophagaceae bacterium]
MHYKLIAISVIAFLTITACSCQNYQWFLGNWKGTNAVYHNSYTPIINLELNITKIEGLEYEGFVKSSWPKDTSVHITNYIKGKLYKTYFVTLKVEPISKKEFPNSGRWRTCQGDDTTKYYFWKENNNIIITGETGCGIVEYIREIDQSMNDNVKLGSIEDNIARKDSLAVGTLLTKRPIDTTKTYAIKSDSIELRLFDDGEIDGDIVSIVYNGKMVVNKLELKATSYILKLPANKGTNTVVLYAENLGKKPPNTAFVRIVYDGKEVPLYLSSDYIKSSAISFIRD